MRARGYRFAAACLLVVAGALCVGTGVAAAQTTTVPPIPVTGGATTTTAPATSGTGDTAGDDLASTGIAADMLVPLGFGLIGAGGILQVASRRPRRDLGLL